MADLNNRFFVLKRMLVILLATLSALLVWPASPADANAGTQSNPFTSLSQAYNAPTSGRYVFNLGSGSFAADVDTSEGGGWVLVLQYVHAGGTNPPLTVLGAGANLPVTSTAALGADESGIAARWGHAGNAAMSQFGGDIETRWFAQTSGHSRVIHFRTSLGDSYFRTGTGSMFSGLSSNFTPLSGHTALIPGVANLGYANKTDYALTAFPFYRDPDNTWAVRGETNNGPGNNGNRWAVDDLPSDLATSTIHRVWVRQANPGVVVNTDNSGPGSLRDAVVFANGRATSTTISFAIPGAGPHIITLTAALPNLTANGLTIDGSTQPGAQCRDLWAGGGHDLRVHLRGPGVLGPVLLGTGQRIRGLAITEFSNGVTLGSASTLASVQCSYVGLRPDGSAPGVTDRAIRALGVSGRIGGLNPGEGNVISGVSIGVITETGSTDTSIQGNFIGTDPTGMAARPNTFRGINSLAGAATWRDITGNLISGNAGPGGIALEGDDRVTASTDTIRIQRNRIGFNRTLSALLANNGDGINFGASSITNVLIGGTDTSDGNEISGSSDGIDLNTVSNIRIRGNTIARATANGIMLVGSSNITIGGTGTGEGNRIGGNTTNGIAVLDGSSNVSVLGNLIQPLTIEGTTAGNADHGIAITGANNVSIGDGTADHQSHLLLSRGASFQPFR